MPYASNGDLPKAVRDRYSERCQSVFRRVFNDTDGDEARRFQVAHTAAGKCNESGKTLAAGAIGVQTPGVHETKGVTLKDLTLTDEGHVVAAFLQTGEVDHDKDYNFPGCIPTKDVPISAYSHGSWPERGGLLPSGRGTVEEKDGLGILTGDFFIDTTHGRDTYLTVRGMKDLQQWSFGFDVLEVAAPPSGVKARRGIKSYDPHEVSPVLLGAGLGTRTLDLKEAKSASDNVSLGFSALSLVLSLIERETDGMADDADAAEDAADAAGLADVRDLLAKYIAATATEVGTPEDVQERAEEAAARMAAMQLSGLEPGYASRSMIAAVKGDLPAGLTFAEASSRLLRGAKLIADRARAIGSRREKDGRPQFSAKRVERLRSQREAINDALTTIDELLAEVEKPKDEEPKSLRGSVARARLRAAQLQSHTAGVH